MIFSKVIIFKISYVSISVPNDDYSQSNLSKMDDSMFLLIYDEVPIDMLEDDRRRETDIYQRIERRWLGYGKKK